MAAPEVLGRGTDAAPLGAQSAPLAAPFAVAEGRLASPIAATVSAQSPDRPRDLGFTGSAAGMSSPTARGGTPILAQPQAVVVEAASRAPLQSRPLPARAPASGEATPASLAGGAPSPDLLHHRAPGAVVGPAELTGAHLAPAALAERVEQVAAVVERAGREGLSRLEVQLPWDGLGVTRLVVQLSAQRARVELACISPESLAAMRLLEAPVRERLETQGFQLQDFHATPDDGRRQDAWEQQAAWTEGRRWQPEAPAPPSRPAPPARPPSGTGGGGLLDVFV